MSRRDVARRLVAGVGVVGALAVGGTAWASSRLGEYSVLAMSGHGMAGGGTAVTALTADPRRAADVRFELVARAEPVAVPGGRPVDGYTINGSSPGPTLRARQGQLVEVRLRNESVEGGTTLHWHGVAAPNAADGVAGVTQDAVPVGGSYLYRFVARDAGTYWYHAHQLSHDQVEGGLLGALVVDPVRRDGDASPPSVDHVALLHLYGGQHTLGGRATDDRVHAQPGERVRVRVINTDQGTAAVWAGVPVRVLAVDGHEVNGPGRVVDRTVLVPAGGRVDVEVTAPADGGAARLHVGGARSVVVGGPAGSEPARAPQPRESLDLLGYGEAMPLRFDATRADRTFDYVIGRRPGLIDGRPGYFWTINGRLYPDVPMFTVRRGDVARVHVENQSAEVHPMHLHGHAVVVLARNGIAAHGSPWVVDSLDVFPGERYDLAFVADNPGIWSDHCHTLEHAADGLVAHLVYEGVTTPFTIHGRAGNTPE